MFRYNNELWQGKHEPMITKKLFDKCQKVLSDRSRPQKRKVKEFAFRGLLFCGECGCAITSETQKGHNYYRCTKKRGKCSQSYIREEVLADQINKQIQKVSLPPSWADKMIEELDKDKEQEAKDGAVFAQNLKSQIKKLEDKLDILLDTHLDGTITKAEYTAKKQKILNQKIEISEKLKDFEQNGNHWLEPAKKFILDSKQAEIIALQKNLFDKRDFLKKIGSNRILRERELFFEPRGAWQILSKSALCVLRTPAERRSREAINAEHTIWLRRWDSNPRHTG
ncbi:recombinase zinc beta ribbon domain-containing protein [Patescibacteria group bacterium]|nr:recombinase zinc beta ribbon domain-containing protein [Patescibacteria group bacterium]